MINPQRLRQARELRGLTQSDLAAKVEVEQSAISQLERGLFSPSSDLIERLALQLQVTPSFFSQPSMFEFPEGSLAYRRTAAMTQTARVHARRHSEVLFALVEHMMAKLDWPQNQLPRLTGESPATAAHVARAQLEIPPEAPISNLVRTLEKSGILVLLLPFPIDGGDGFSTWIKNKQERPVVVLGSVTAGDRQRFTTAHELGHLVLHQAFNGSLPQIDREADDFAAELLLPGEALRQQIDLPVSLAQLGKLKATWKVSIQALVRRAKDLQLCTERQYRYLCEQIGALGWRISEPGIIAPERPRSVSQMAELLYSYGPDKLIDYHRIATEMHLTPAYVREILDMFVSGKQLGKTPHAGAAIGGSVVQFTERRA